MDRARRLAAAIFVALAVPAAVAALTTRGTPGPDVMHGTKGKDVLYGLAGNDTLVGGRGSDRLYGGPGNDRIVARDGAMDFVSCGSGKDTAVLDELDRTDGTCENVSGVAAATSPVVLGALGDTGDGWRLRVVASTPDATASISTWDPAHPAPRQGRQFALVSVWAKRTGRTPAYLHPGFRLRVSDGRYVYTSLHNSCGSIPGPDLSLEDPRVFPGGTVKGNLCWSVRRSGSANLTLFTAYPRRVVFALS